MSKQIKVYNRSRTDEQSVKIYTHDPASGGIKLKAKKKLTPVRGVRRSSLVIEVDDIADNQYPIIIEV